jgi:hypothetical protein
VNEAPRLSAPEVAALQKKFKHAFRFRDWRGAGRAAVELGKGSPETFKDTKFVLLVQNVAIALSKEQAEADLMQMLGDDLGSDGLDVLYAFIEGQGKSPVATTAAKLLADEKRLAKATPALRIALEFRQASCVRRLELFDRATNEGDSRVRLALETLGRACFPDNANLNKAIFALRVKFPNK